MPRGGARPNSGPKKGALYKNTLAKQEHERQLRARVAGDVDALYEALRSAAIGVTHLMARDKDGTWKEVTEPATMAKVLNSGDTFYRLTARNPDVRALINLFDRLCGSATQAIEMEVSGDLHLVERLMGARRRFGSQS
jgi:hypothetical protein